MITVAETAVFIRQAADVWRDEERAEFINYVAANPDAGDLIPDTRGLRKLRWSGTGIGQRGGVRIIYFYHDLGMPIYLLLVYAKARRETLNPDETRRVQALVSILKQAHGRK